MAYETSPGSIAYEAYKAATHGVSLATGDALPEWPDLGGEYKQAWEASAESVIHHCVELKEKIAAAKEAVSEDQPNPPPAQDPSQVENPPNQGFASQKEGAPNPGV